MKRHRREMGGATSRVLASLGVASLAVLAVSSFVGCGMTVEEMVIDEPRFEETGLSPSLLARRMEEIDSYYAEPRTPEKVVVSYSTALQSVSMKNDYAALWRATRACAWLAHNANTKAEREKYAVQGIRVGRVARDKVSTHPEPFYYLALCETGLADVRQTITRQLVNDLRYNLKMSIEIDRDFDHCGGQRVLGQIIVKMQDYPLYSFGTFEEGLKLIEEAVARCPQYGENHLVLAEALLEDEELEKARAELEVVINSPVPPDRSTEHNRWLRKASEMLATLQGK